MGLGGQRHGPAVLPPEKTHCTVGGPQGRYGRVRKISHPPGFGPRTVRPVASRYTDCDMPAHFKTRIVDKPLYWLKGVEFFWRSQSLLSSSRR